jgi:hypothetical protein
VSGLFSVLLALAAAALAVLALTGAWRLLRAKD